ncbi:hypothetical protein [Paraliobacillus sediminis]|uniref:hypothetical protein n=1 Tax=Paraliobacillus sediminis TaxID=1885916 RepID=UPI000E3BE151|nr:hypothetical protein [Paraliobacillus sediminis]
MSNNLKGYISVDFGIDTVFLLHKVHGRFTEMELDKGDLILIKAPFKNEEYMTLEKTFNTLFNDLEKYEGYLAKVTINPDTTSKLDHKNKMYNIKQLFEDVSAKRLTHEEASEIAMRWESAYEDCEID